MNKVFITGNVTKNPEMKVSQNGKDIAKFCVAAKDYKSTDFLYCVAFGNTAKFIGEYIKKGMGVEIDGKVKTNTWEDENGKKVTTYNIVVNSIEFGKGGNKKEEKRDSDDDLFGNELSDFEPLDDADLPF